MNRIKLNGEIYSERLRLTTNTKKQVPQVDFLLDAPFNHPVRKCSDAYHSRLRTYIIGDEAEWIINNLDTGSHLEIREGFVQSWYSPKQKKTFYRIVGYDIDHVASMQVAPFSDETNIGRFSGFFRRQFYTGEYDGKPMIGVNIAATPDIQRLGSSYCTFLNAWVYGDDAVKLNGNVRKDRPLDLLEGVLQSFKNAENNTYGLYIHTTKIEY